MESFIHTDFSALQLFSLENRVRPLPRVKPMLATRKEIPFDHPDWLFELRHEGCRAIAVVHNSFVQLQSRHSVSVNTVCPQIIEELKMLPHTLILDGEIVTKVSEEGKPVQRYHVNDIIHLNGFNLFEVPLIKRKELLRAALESASLKQIVYTEHIRQRGIELFGAAIENNFEGIIARNVHSPYRSGRRTRDWLKIKILKQQEVVIAGFTSPEKEQTFFGALLLGIRNGNKLEFAGICRRGFTEKSIEKIYNKLSPHFASQPPFSEVVKLNSTVQWLKPKLTAEVLFADWNKDGRMRYAVFSKLKSSKAPGETVQQTIAVTSLKDNQSLGATA